MSRISALFRLAFATLFAVVVVAALSEQRRSESTAVQNPGNSSLGASASIAAHAYDTPTEDIPAGYQTLVASVWPGQKLYLKSDKTFIGVLKDVESDHRFPDGSVRDAVFIDYAAGDPDWMTRKTAQQLYVIR